LRRLSTRISLISVEITLLDDLDHALVHALSVHPRATFRQLGDVLGASDQTIARRYRRLREQEAVRVVGRLNAPRMGYVDWLLRLQCTPDAAPAIAAAIAARDDTSWIRLASGGTEVMCAVQARDAEQRDALLLRKLPSTRQVTSVAALWVLHVYRGGLAPWAGSARPPTSGGVRTLDDGQVAALRALAGPVPQPAGEPVGIDADDRRLLDALARDGRTGFAELAAATGLHESTARRRMEHLQATGALYFDVDVDSARLGIMASAMLYLSVAPGAVVATGEALAEHEAVRFAAATTGPHNLVASVACRDATALYEYLTLQAGALPAVEAIETVPVLRTFKRSGPLASPAAGG
jgi:DNA-binding Lrp family transcriptional regulator